MKPSGWFGRMSRLSRVALMDGDVADRVHGHVLEDRREADAGVRGLPHAARGGREVEHPRVRLDDGDVDEASTHVGRPDRAMPQPVDIRGGELTGGRGGDARSGGGREGQERGEAREGLHGACLRLYLVRRRTRHARKVGRREGRRSRPVVPRSDPDPRKMRGAGGGVQLASLHGQVRKRRFSAWSRTRSPRTLPRPTDTAKGRREASGTLRRLPDPRAMPNHQGSDMGPTWRGSRR